MESTEKRIKAHLETGKSLSVVEALDLFRTIELRKVVSNLRKQGMLIDDEWTHTQNSKKKYKRYFLHREKDAVDRNSVQNKFLFHDEDI